MNRRQFLAALVGTTAAAVLQPRFDALSWNVAPKWLRTATVESLRKGDLFSIEGVYAVNPITFAPTEHLKKFVITADLSPADDVKDWEGPIWPPLIAEGPYQTVAALPENDARLITYNGLDWRPVVHDA